MTLDRLRAKIATIRRVNAFDPPEHPPVPSDGTHRHRWATTTGTQQIGDRTVEVGECDCGKTLTR